VGVADENPRILVGEVTHRPSAGVERLVSDSM
jgi:hypothetical protein